MVLASSAHDVEPGTQTVPLLPALIVPLLDRGTTESARAATIAQGLLEPVAARFAARVAPACDLDETAGQVSEWLGLSTRLLLLPFGGCPANLGAALESALSAPTGEQVRPHTLPAPTGAASGPLFAPLEGVACAATQLTPLLRLFPGWSHHYLGLSCAAVRLVLFCPAGGGELQQASGEAARAVLELLESGCVRRSGLWQRDGELFASYLRSLVAAVLRGSFLQCADTLHTTALRAFRGDLAGGSERGAAVSVETRTARSDRAVPMGGSAWAAGQVAKGTGREPPHPREGCTVGGMGVLEISRERRVLVAQLAAPDGSLKG